MPDLTVIEFGLLGVFLLLGLVVGWIIKNSRCAKEKIAINAGWQEQIARQRLEHERLAEQNKSLMEQISDNQASHKDSNMRAKELSESLKETFERRDELQRQLKELRTELEVALTQRDKSITDSASTAAEIEASNANTKEKDDKIFYLSRELQSWQGRVPPLVERFQKRDIEAKETEAQLQSALQRIDELESVPDPSQMHIEPIDSSSITDGLDASNDQYDETAEFNNSGLVARLREDSVDESVSVDLTQDNSVEANESTDVDEGFDTEASETEATNGEDSSEETPKTDNLRLIRGIGPAIEKTLNDLGINLYSQISEMSEYDIDRVAQHMKGFRSRIYREDWVGQARLLQEQKNDPSS
jgi:predicted flap endonuclease-1-like 5' DNA nuclease